MSYSQRDLSKKADQILFDYGGLEGLAKKPVWLIGEVLSAFFTEEERKEIMKLRVFKGIQEDILRALKSKAG